MPLVCFGLAWWLAQTDTLKLAEARTLDWRTKYRAFFQAPPDRRIVIALFEDNTEAMIEPWPVNRAWHGRLTSFLAAEKTAVVTWDVILDSRRSDGGDAAMAAAATQAIRAGTKVVLGASSSRTIGENRPEPGDPTQAITQIEGDDAPLTGENFALLPFPEIRRTAWWGMANVQFDADGIIREIPLIVRFGRSYYPALSLQTLMVYLQVPADKVRVKLGDAIYLPTARRTWRIPIDRRGMFLLNYRYDQAGAHPDFPTHTYTELLFKINNYRVEHLPDAPKPPDLAGKFVFVGQIVTAKADAGPTPLSGSSPLVLVHANALNNMLADDYARRTSEPLVWGVTLILAYAGLVLLTHRSVVILIAGSVLGVLGYAATATWFWSESSWWVPAVGPLLGFASLQFIIIVRRTREEQRTRQEIKSMFGTYVSPQLVDRMIETGEAPQLGGLEADITAYFSDIQGFSSFSEQLEATRLVTLMNEYLTACTDLVHEEGGTLDKYVGDAVVAMFGAPVPLTDHAYRACVTAARVQSRMSELRAKWSAEGEKWPALVATMRTRIGLNTGRCVVGNMGSRTRFNYTMMGDDVNLAARLESGAKFWGVYTLCSEATRAGCVQHGGDRVVFRPLGQIVVKGRTAAVPIFEIVGLRENVTAATHECVGHFAQGLARYHAGDWQAAREFFERSATLEIHGQGGKPGDHSNPSWVYLGIVAENSRQPAPTNWTGVHVMAEK